MISQADPLLRESTICRELCVRNLGSCNVNDRGSKVVNELCYKCEGAGSILAGVIGFFIDIKSFQSHYGPGVDSASNRNEFQEHFLGVKAAGA